MPLKLVPQLLLFSQSIPSHPLTPSPTEGRRGTAQVFLPLALWERGQGERVVFPPSPNPFPHRGEKGNQAGVPPPRPLWERGQGGEGCIPPIPPNPASHRGEKGNRSGVPPPRPRIRSLTLAAPSARCAHRLTAALASGGIAPPCNDTARLSPPARHRDG